MFWCSLVELDAILTLIFLIVYGLGSLRNITGSSFDINFFSRLFPVLFLVGFLLEAGGDKQVPLVCQPLSLTTESCLARGCSSLFEPLLNSRWGPQGGAPGETVSPFQGSVTSLAKGLGSQVELVCHTPGNSFSSLLSQDLSSVLGPQSMGSMIEWALVALTIVILYNFRSLESLLLLLFAFLGQYFMLHSVDFLSFFIALEVQNFCFFVLCGLCSSGGPRVGPPATPAPCQRTGSSLAKGLGSQLKVVCHTPSWRSRGLARQVEVVGSGRSWGPQGGAPGETVWRLQPLGKGELQSKSFSVEGALKYFLLSAFSSGVMLFWFSAIYLQTGQSSFLAITPFHDESFSFFYTFMIVGALMFKLGAAPLHLWVTQIYGNVTRPLLLFVSTAPKLAFFGFWLNAFHGFYYSSGGPQGEVNIAARSLSSCSTVARQSGSCSVLFFAAFSLILGAFAAYSQPALRSLFAYSTINEVGLLLSAVETAGWNTLFQHLGIYLISQVLLWNCFHRKFLALLAVSFAGLPPLAGFFGKAWIFWHISSVGFYSILALALFCTCVSLVYYLRLIRLFYENPTPSLYVKYSGTVIGKDTLSLLSDGLTREKVVATCLILLFSIPFFVLKPSFVL